MIDSLKIVFSRLSNVVVSVLVAIIVFTISVWLPNFSSIISVWRSGSASIIQKLNFMWTLFGSIQTNFTIVSATYTILIAILFGINISLFLHFVRTRKTLLRGGRGTAAGVGGLVSGIFGVGCASCGTFLLTTVLATIGAGGIIAYLPLGGEEFGILGVILLGYSGYMILKKIEESLVCLEK